MIENVEIITDQRDRGPVNMVMQSTEVQVVQGT